MCIRDRYLPESFVNLLEPLSLDDRQTLEYFLNSEYYNYRLTINSPDIIELETQQLIRFHLVQVQNQKIDEFGYLKDYPYWFGEKNTNVFPGTLDAKKAIVTGDFGLDAPICLDFRKNENNPIVVWLNDDFLWEKISNSYKEFAKIIGLS